VLNVPIAETTHDEVIASGLPIFAADPRAETAQPPARSAIVVFGSEGPGVSEKIRRVAKTIRIDMSDRVESLNVAASAAILLSRSYAERR
jgi:tRNA G18 (ribose-2'-O)-methylase SpoU